METADMRDKGVETSRSPSAVAERGIRENEVADAITRFKKDPVWLKIFEEAPEGAKNRIALNFWVSCNNQRPDFDRGVYLSLREALEKRLTFDDLQYLIATADKDVLKSHYRRLMMNLPEVANAKTDDDIGEAATVQEGAQ